MLDTSVLSADIDDGTAAGGTNTSRTISIDLLGNLLAAVPGGAAADAYLISAVHGNALAKSTAAGRHRALRHLRELYLLDPSRVLFRALRDLWDEDCAARPLLAGLAAYARDSVFRASGAAVLPNPPGVVVTSDDLARAVVERFPDSYNASTAAKIGRNTASSWTQTGHLVGKNRKVRAMADARPASAALAVLLGHLEGIRGQALFASRWAQLLDRDRDEVRRLTEQAAARGYLELRSAGGVVEVGFHRLLRPATAEMAP